MYNWNFIKFHSKTLQFASLFLSFCWNNKSRKSSFKGVLHSITFLSFFQYNASKICIFSCSFCYYLLPLTSFCSIVLIQRSLSGSNSSSSLGSFRLKAFKRFYISKHLLRKTPLGLKQISRDQISLVLKFTLL